MSFNSSRVVNSNSTLNLETFKPFTHQVEDTLSVYVFKSYPLQNGVHHCNALASRAQDLSKNLNTFIDRKIDLGRKDRLWSVASMIGVLFCVAISVGAVYLLDVPNRAIFAIAFTITYNGIVVQRGMHDSFYFDLRAGYFVRKCNIHVFCEGAYTAFRLSPEKLAKEIFQLKIAQEIPGMQ